MRRGCPGLSRVGPAAPPSLVRALGVTSVSFVSSVAQGRPEDTGLTVVERPVMWGVRAFSPLMYSCSLRAAVCVLWGEAAAPWSRTGWGWDADTSSAQPVSRALRRGPVAGSLFFRARVHVSFTALLTRMSALQIHRRQRGGSGDSVQF